MSRRIPHAADVLVTLLILAASACRGPAAEQEAQPETPEAPATAPLSIAFVGNSSIEKGELRDIVRAELAASSDTSTTLRARDQYGRLGPLIKPCSNHRYLG